MTQRNDSDMARNEPSREEIIQMWDLAMLETASGLDAMQYFARAVLKRYGQAPAASAEPVLRIYAEGSMRTVTEWLDGARDLPDGDHSLYAAPVAAQAPQPVTYLGADIAERLDSMADDQPAGSQAQSDLYAAATVWRKHVAAPSAQAPAANGDLRSANINTLRALVAYLREEADFNRSWTDGRRGGPANPRDEYVNRRLELAARSDGWADQVEALLVAAPSPQGDAFDFTIHYGTTRVLRWKSSGCRPATDEECALWDALHTTGPTPANKREGK